MNDEKILKEMIHDCLNGRVQKVKKFLDMGIDPNSTFDGVSMLYSSLSEDSYDVFELLLKYGADINKDKNIFELSLNKEVFKFEFKKYELGEEVDEPNTFTTEFLIKHGININQLNYQNQTPLDIAIQYKHNKAERLLRSLGAKTLDELKQDENKNI